MPPHPAGEVGEGGKQGRAEREGRQERERGRERERENECGRHASERSRGRRTGAGAGREDAAAARRPGRPLPCVCPESKGDEEMSFGGEAATSERAGERERETWAA